jgi:uncharacterized protein (TIGR02246 family)
MNRSSLLKVFLCAVAMQLASYAAQGAEVRDAEVVAQRFLEAWNAHAPSIFTVAVDSDADWIHARGAKLRGRADIESYLAREHSTRARETRMVPLGIESRLLCEGVAIVALSWQISRENEAAFRGMTQFIAQKTGSRWVVISGQVTSGPASQPAAGTAEQGAAGDAPDPRA